MHQYSLKYASILKDFKKKIHFCPEVPRITVTQQTVFASVGGSATLECQATGVPPPLVHWFKSK